MVITSFEVANASRMNSCALNSLRNADWLIGKKLKTQLKNCCCKHHALPAEPHGTSYHACKQMIVFKNHMNRMLIINNALFLHQKYCYPGNFLSTGVGNPGPGVLQALHVFDLTDRED